MSRLDELAKAAAHRMRRLQRAIGIYRPKLVRSRGTNSDTEDSKRVEESQRNFRLIVDSIPVPVAVTTPGGEVETLNRSTLEYFGKTFEELKDWKTSDVVHPDDLQCTIARQLEAHQSGLSYNVESRHRRADGVYRWFNVLGLPLRDTQGHILRWFHLQIDIDDRKRAEERLRRNDTFLAEGQRLTSIGSFSWCLDTDEITFSEELYRIFEFEHDAPVTLERIGNRVHPEDIPLLSERVKGARDGETAHDYEIRLRMLDGSVKHLHTISRVTRHQDGRLEFIGAVQDVTQRRLSEEALAKLRSEFAHVARVMSLGVLTASISHEINQPLAAIITNGKTGLHWLARPEPNLEKARELITRLVADARRASETIGRIRTMAAGQAPKSTVLSLGEIVEESIIFMRCEFQSKSIAVSLDLAPTLPPVVGDRIQLQQVIVNLVINAVQALGQSGRRNISIRTTLSDPETVCCDIEDSGPGIDPTHLPLLFDSFFTTKDTGMGMGLPISRSIVEAHGGRIRADNNSALGGARFSFALPTIGAG